MAEVLTVDGHANKTLAVVLFKDVQNAKCASLSVHSCFFLNMHKLAAVHRS